MTENNTYNLSYEEIKEILREELEIMQEEAEETKSLNFENDYNNGGD